MNHLLKVTTLPRGWKKWMHTCEYLNILKCTCSHEFWNFQRVKCWWTNWNCRILCVYSKKKKNKWKLLDDIGGKRLTNTMPIVMWHLKQTWVMLRIIFVSLVTTRQGPAGPFLPRERSKVSVLSSPWCELGTASIVSDDNGAGWPQMVVTF